MRFLEAGIVDSSELTEVGARNQAQVLCQSTHSFPLAITSGPDFSFKQVQSNIQKNGRGWGTHEPSCTDAPSFNFLFLFLAVGCTKKLWPRTKLLKWKEMYLQHNVENMEWVNLILKLPPNQCSWVPSVPGYSQYAEKIPKAEMDDGEHFGVWERGPILCPQE